MTRRWLAPGVSLFVEVDDRSRFGSPLTTRPDDETRTVFAPVLAHVEEHGPGGLGVDGPGLLRAVVDGSAFAAIADRTADGWCLHDDVLHPSAVVRFATLHAQTLDEASLSLDPADDEWPGVHDLVAALHGSGADLPDRAGDATRAAATRPGATRTGATLADRLLAGLDQIGALVDAPLPVAVHGPGLTFLGHNTVVVRTDRSTVVLDPFLPAGDASSDAVAYRPLAVSELGRVDALVLTHSHPDHFDPATLLRFPCDTTIVVPRVGRETLLAVAMAERLRQLGFTDVVELPWWEAVAVGDIDIHALPFYGEQPTDGGWLHPDVRNAGNTYVISTPDVAAAFLADSGRDHLGDSRDLGLVAPARGVPAPDVVFAGYRGWRVYPAQHLLSSVARYLLFVPPSRWSGRMQLMNGFDEALDLAERWSAGRLVPYADGGAPWFWTRGLGPRLDAAASEVPGFDPFPERILDHARARAATASGATISSPVAIELLRPNDSLVGWADTGGPRRESMAGNAWPFATPADRLPGAGG